MVQSAIKEQLRSELERLNYLIKETAVKLKDAERRICKLSDLPNGTLTCERKGFHSIQYYLNLKENGKVKSKYIGTPESPLVQEYKKKYFFRTLLDILKHNEKVIRKTLKELKDYSVEAIHKHLPNAYKFLPKECYVDGQMTELNDWTVRTYKRNPWKLPDDPTIACDGTEMRSKGEAIIYDNALRMKLPFQYDSMHTLFDADGVEHRLSPDFLFRCKDGRNIILEHFGKLDNADYAVRNATKLHEYLLCGYVIGDNLFITSDNANHNTNERAIIETLELIKKRVFGL